MTEHRSPDARFRTSLLEENVGPAGGRRHHQAGRWQDRGLTHGKACRSRKDFDDTKSFLLMRRMVLLLPISD